MSGAPHADTGNSGLELNLPRLCKAAIERSFKFPKELKWCPRQLLMRVRECPECERLWEEYTDANFDFVKINRQTKMAKLRQESLEVMGRLRERGESAAQGCDAALEPLKQHQATHQTACA